MDLYPQQTQADQGKGAMDLKKKKTHEGGLSCGAQRPRSHGGAVCAKKKNGRLCLVSDCRATNSLFRPTPHLPMGTRAAWDDVTLGEHTEAWLSLSDLKDYFYACALPRILSSYFCCDDVDRDFLSTLNNPDLLD